MNVLHYIGCLVSLHSVDSGAPRGTMPYLSHATCRTDSGGAELAPFTNID